MAFFKAYDMRGTFGEDFTLADVWRIGRNLPAAIRRADGGAAASGPFRMLVGRDARETSPAVSNALVAGLRTAGAEVADIGPATTPMVYFFTAEDGFDASVMVTASHNPPGDNGLKVSRRGAVPVGYDSGLALLEKMCAEDASEPPGGETFSAGIRDMTDPSRLRRYVGWLKSHGRFDPDSSPLRFAVDCSDGMASLFAHDIFGERAMLLNSVPDGSFPHHSPNPLRAEAREQIAAAVRENGLDCGVIFDGDADRCMFVDETGAFIQPDYLIPVLAGVSGAAGDIVLHDVRTSRAAIERLVADGFRPQIGKVGHAFAKRLMRETGAVCGGELAGHYYFREFHCCDSGALAALRILGAFSAAKASGVTVSALLAPVTGKYANSGETNFRVEDKPAAISRVLAAAAKLGAETGRCEIDGVRLEFPEGWISVRQSNTEPYLRLLAECEGRDRLAGWMASLSAAVAGGAQP